jgi:hypothetical protein
MTCTTFGKEVQHMRDAYLPPELMRVASIEDLTLEGNGGLLADVCLTINGTEAGQHPGSAPTAPDPPLR